MIAHVYFRSAMSKKVDEVFVATCDEEIADAVRGFGGNAVMTSDTHQRATDRVAEAVQDMDATHVINIQGDEPMIVPEVLDQLVGAMENDPTLDCANIMVAIASDDEHEDTNAVKVVVDREGYAMYFSREPIPSKRMGATGYARYKQTGLICLRKEFVRTFSELTPTPIEVVESVDMMRLLEHGYRVKMVLTESTLYGVDTPEDRAAVEARMANDPLVGAYAGRFA
jgi:3-deoxy-manno-octulosonate cytidylyltransferase (CMP-KDO synthetase)